MAALRQGPKLFLIQTLVSEMATKNLQKYVLPDVPFQPASAIRAKHYCKTVNSANHGNMVPLLLEAHRETLPFFTDFYRQPLFMSVLA